MFRLPSRGASHERLMWRIGLAAVALIVPATIVPALLSQTARAVRKYEEWQVAGPPCPAGRPGARLKATLVLERVAFSRERGHAACTTLNDRGGRGFSTFPVCQFTAPGLLRVTTRTGEHWFVAPPGVPATVAVHGEGAECRLAINKDRFRPGLDRPWG